MGGIIPAGQNKAAIREKVNSPLCTTIECTLVYLRWERLLLEEKINRYKSIMGSRKNIGYHSVKIEQSSAIPLFYNFTSNLARCLIVEEK